MVRWASGRLPAHARDLAETLVQDSLFRTFRKIGDLGPLLIAATGGKLTQLNRVRDLREPAIPRGNRFERLSGSRAGQHSIWINEQYRVCFRWKSGYADEVEITDDHSARRRVQPAPRTVRAPLRHQRVRHL